MKRTKENDKYKGDRAGCVKNPVGKATSLQCEANSKRRNNAKQASSWGWDVEEGPGSGGRP